MIGSQSLDSQDSQLQEQEQEQEPTTPKAREKLTASMIQGWTPGRLAGPLTPDGDEPPKAKEIKKLPFPPVPIEVFSPRLRRIIKEVAKGKSVPEEMILGILIALGSCCIGRSRGLIYNASSNWTEVANLYLLLISETGAGKSHAYSYIFKHVIDLEAKQKAAWRTAQDRYEEEMIVYKKKKDTSVPAPKKPKNTQYLLDDSTIEAAVERLVDNPRGLFWSVDEFSGFFNGLDRYNKNGGGEGKRKLLSAWDSRTISSTRKSKDGAANETYITRGTIGMFGAIQPGLVDKLFSPDDETQGWPQRFVYIRSQTTKPLLLPLPDIDPDIAMYLRQITEKLLGLGMPVTENGIAETEYVTLSHDAHEKYRHYHNLLSKQTFGTGDTGYAAKIARITLRITLILHFTEWAVSDEPDYCQEIDDDTMDAAVQLSNYLTYHTDYVISLISGKIKNAEGKEGEKDHSRLIRFFQKKPWFAADFHPAHEYMDEGFSVVPDHRSGRNQVGPYLSSLAAQGVLVEKRTVHNTGWYRAINHQQYIDEGGEGGAGGDEKNSSPSE